MSSDKVGASSQPFPVEQNPAQPANNNRSSWFSKAKNFASVAATVTTQAVQAGVESSKKAIAEMKAAPTTIQCSNCPLLLEVPPNLFDWECEQKHINDRTKTVCATCHLAKPKQADRTIICAACKGVTIVPETNASKALKNSVETTKKFVAATAASAKDSVNYLKSAPETFHCSHCNSLLAVPTGPWMCQTCVAENAEDAKQCKQCTQKKSEQRAICGVCRQSTQIPTTNFGDGLNSTFRDISKSSRKIYYDISKKPYVTCARCQNHIMIPIKSVPAAVDPVPAVQNNNNNNNNNAQASQASANNAPKPEGESEGQASPPPAYVPAASLAGIVCDKCKNPIEQ